MTQQKSTGVEVELHAFLISALDGKERSASCLLLYSLYRLDRRLGGPQSLFEPCGDDKNFLIMPGIETRFPVDMHTELYRLLLLIKKTR
jgi:hypothetical protein